MSLLFGPLLSRRFGMSLGVDLSPDRKRCNFDCLYCELEPAKPVREYWELPGTPPSPEEVVEQLKRALPRYPRLDVVTLTANGEPTLYPYLREVVEGVVQLERAQRGEHRWRSLILSNGSRIGEPEVRESLAQLSIVKLSLDSANPKTFKKLDRPVAGIRLEEIVEGMVQFRRQFRGELILEVLVVKGLNDREEEFQLLREVFREIAPDRVDLSTIDRPPAYRVEPVPVERLWQLGRVLEGVPVYIPIRKGEVPPLPPVELSREELLETLRRRPWSDSDLELLTEKGRKLFRQLLEEGVLEQVEVAGVQFYRPREG